jgi:hypothetical protein
VTCAAADRLSVPRCLRRCIAVISGSLHGKLVSCCVPTPLLQSSFVSLLLPVVQYYKPLARTAQSGGVIVQHHGPWQSVPDYPIAGGSGGLYHPPSAAACGLVQYLPRDPVIQPIRAHRKKKKNHITFSTTSWTFKTVHFTSITGYKRFSKVILSFSFLFILAEYLKNHCKSQKNHKIESPILLDSTLVHLRSEHIIWYVLVYFFLLYL